MAHPESRREKPMKTADIMQRIDELLKLNPDEGDVGFANAAQITQGCVSLLTLVYGAKSNQLVQFDTTIAGISSVSRNYWIITSCQGVLRNLKREIEQGLTGSLRQQITGEVLTDLVQFARSALDEGGDGAKNVAAVLTAAAFEDTIRRMGQTLAGVIGQEDLSDVLKKLKDAGVIQSPQAGIAQAYLSFRNHALHANWNNIQRESVLSVLGFVEQLLLKHFS
jgi:hypothetical protein